MADDWIGSLDDLVGKLFGGLTGGDQAGPSTRRTDHFGRDLTAAARDGQLDPVVGRDEEIRREMGSGKGRDEMMTLVQEVEDARLCLGCRAC